MAKIFTPFSFEGGKSCVAIAFAHISESIPPQFWDYAKPIQPSPNCYQIRKWHSRRLAFFLLTQLFDRANLPKEWLNEIKRTPSGRPYLNKALDFNISHSGDYVAVILDYSGKDYAVGIDIEHPQKIRQFGKLLNHYANKEELIELNPNKADDFYLSWCLREAVLKTQGVGIIKLSEVTHLPNKKVIKTDYCPKGTLHFIPTLPFYLAYFFQGEIPPTLFHYNNQRLQNFTHFRPLAYSVN